ncbi:MAG: sugar phosphate isomerase/epimerase, partial [Porticoccaceae bacterium]|nr:sugar phosphate isomerase/epimerase [Porticoccaceae bacterium]
PPFKISLAQWSLHRTLFGATHSSAHLRSLPPAKIAELLRSNPSYLLRGKLDPLDFPVYARQQFGIDAVEYVNSFYLGRGRDQKYLTELKRRADGEGVRSVLIMCDLEGDLGDPDPQQRQQAIDNHHQWVEAAALLGCHAIRVNAHSRGTPEEQRRLVADSLNRLAQYSHTFGIHILVENHGGLSSDPDWLIATIKATDHPLVGTLPDFGNFYSSADKPIDRYDAVKQMMPYARAVSAKTLDFDADGQHLTFDFQRLMKTVMAAGYDGYVGIEYEGEQLSEDAGIKATLALLKAIANSYSPTAQQYRGGINDTV